MYVHDRSLVTERVRGLQHGKIADPNIVTHPPPLAMVTLFAIPPLGWILSASPFSVAMP